MTGKACIKACEAEDGGAAGIERIYLCILKKGERSRGKAENINAA